MSWIKSITIFFVNTIALLLVINISLVYYSPTFIYKLGGAGVSKLKTEKCYRTFLYDNLAANNPSNDKVVVIGDSYSEGMGDEFLANEEDFGLIRKLDTKNTDYIIAGRNGYGSLGAYNEASACIPYLGAWTSWDYNEDQISKVMMIFYEGNDLNNNLVELKRMSFDQELSTKQKLQLLLPVFQLIQTAIRQLIYKFEGLKEINKGVINTTKSGIEIPVYAQASATELTDEQLTKSLGLVKKS